MIGCDIFMLELHPLTIEHRSFFQERLSQFPPLISEHTFTNLFVWSHYRSVFWAEYRGSLLIFSRKASKSSAGEEGYCLFGPPVGPLSLATLAEDNIVACAERLPEKLLGTIDRPSAVVTADRDNSDYVYLVEDLADLTGRKYSKKRNLIKQCLDGYHCEYETITADNIKECIALQHRWCALRQCSEHPMLAGETQAVLTTFEHFARFNLIGGAIRVDGDIQAYTVGEALSPGVAVCHFEKAMPHVTGLGQLINHWFAQKSLTEFQYINREQDLGIKGLRQAKESYHPCHMVSKVSVIFQKN